ncbi:MAG TPA: type II toxin-antitoxin system RelE/ParE family toxin [Kiloniellaceae bacterium]
MPFGVVLTDDALRDLDDTCGYIAQHDTSKSAAYVLERIEKALVDLAEFPERGRHPRELADLGITEFREIFFKPYRLVYRVEQRRVVVYLIADGRRDMQSLLIRRLLNP